MATKIKLRRDIKANWESINPILADGEIAFIKDTNELKIGDGITHFNDLPTYSRYSKKLLVEKSILSDVNGISLDIDSNKIYEGRLEYYDSISGPTKVIFNDDNTNGHYVLPELGSSHSSIDYTQYNMDGMLISSRDNSLTLFKIYPKAKKMLAHVSSSVGFQANRFMYYTGDVVTKLTFVAPGDNIPCIFKLWEIDE